MDCATDVCLTQQERAGTCAVASLYYSIPFSSSGFQSNIYHAAQKKKVKDYIGQLSNEHDPARMLVTNTLLPSSLVLLYPVTLFPQHVAKED